MNPPSAIHGAMSRDRKPFTYTPGGLDLSEIKSERMAKRLMRNAMNEGVPQQPVQPIQSPPAATIAVPNFNCLPVQVFPAFNLPANPKSLLRTRSNPVSREPPQKVQPPSQFVNNRTPAQYDTFNKNTPSINNNRPTSMFEYGAPATSFMNYGNDSNATFPEISYDAQYFQVPKINNYVENTAPLVTINSDFGNNNNIAKEEFNLAKRNNSIMDQNQSIREEFYVAPAYEHKDSIIDIKPEVLPAPEVKVVPELPIQDVGYNDEQKEVKIVTKEVKKETKTEDQNGDQNGDTEAVMTVKLPTKKSAAKTETKVEVSRKTLPDGSIEEVKKTITKTTIDGKTEIKTKTETTIIPKDDEEEEEVEEEEEEENSEVVVQEVDDKEVDEKPVTTVVQKAEEFSTQIRENGHDNIIKTEERSETTTTSTKKVVIVQNDKEDEIDEEEEEVEEEEIEEAEPVTVVLKQPSAAPAQELVKDEKDAQVEEDEEAEFEQTEKPEALKIQEDANEVVKSEVEEKTTKEAEDTKKSVEQEEDEVEEAEEEEVYEEAEEKEVEVQVKKELETPKEASKEENVESEYTDEEVEPAKEEVSEKPVEESKAPAEEIKPTIEAPETPAEKPAAPVEIEIPIQKESDEKKEVFVEKQEEVKQVVTEETKTEKLETPESKVPLREPSVPLEKVEDVEIKPIGAGNFVTKSRTETTEIITGTADKPTGLLTEYNRTENIVTVNRTTKTLDYENTQQTVPTLSYFTPHIEKFPPLPQSTNRPYQPVYPSEPTSERRHSLLLERLSVERQVPTNEIYQNTQQYSQTVEQQNQWAQEPRVEILTIENVKPSSITNQQWYQQTDKKDVAYNNVAPVAPPVVPSWTQPKPPQQPTYQPAYQPPSQPAYQSPSQPAYQPPSQPAYQSPSQPAYQPPSQPAYQSPSQPTYQAQHQPKPVYQPPQPQPVYQTQSQYQPQPQYQPSYSENIQQNTSSQQNSYSTQQNYSTYTPKPANWDTPSINTQNQYSSDSYQSTQQHSSSYVPPPWEQDSTYVVDNSQSYYQVPPQPTLTPDVNQGWNPPASKFTKTTPTAYIPPKPNQSFVKHVTISEPPKQPGRKTYYSEYERRYISVPESTYIPGETKLQPQPDPSPAYYYDNNEPAETVEHEWRKELREFTEKAQTQPQQNVKPPWENSNESQTQTQYAKTQETTYTATPTWSQTLRPQSWRERSFESEFVSQEWPKTSTLGRGRPLSSYGKESIPERTRGVSVDRYNPNNYQSPVPEPHPPVQTFTHNPPAPHGPGYHNPNVPTYHAYSRASAEPREQPVYQQPRARIDSRASPFQSRSFKYLQWITGTDD